MSLLPEVCPFTGIRTDYRYDPESKSLIIARTQCVQDILDWNKTLYNDPDETWRKADDRMYLVARIPNLVIEAWLNEDPPLNVFRAKMGRDGKPNEDMVRLLRKLRDPEWRYLRCHPMGI